MSFLGNKKGQVTIFVIIAIVIIVSVLIFIFIRAKTTNPTINYRNSENPQGYITECLSDAVKETETIILKQGGYKQPRLNISYEGQKIAVLCYNNMYNEPCINQEPLYITHLEKEIKESIQESVEKCYETMTSDYQKKGMIISLGNTESLDVDIKEKTIIINIIKELMIKQDTESKNYKNFKIIISSPVYKLGTIAQEIISQESLTCDFDYVQYQINYPAIKIIKEDINGENKVYSLIDKKTQNTLNFAIRGCVNPRI